MALNYLNKLNMLVAASLISLTACDNAVMVSTNVPYIIKGDSNSVLYPLNVKRNGEDVFIQFKKTSPVTEVFLIDAFNRAIPFNFTISGDTLIVPGKFDHLRLGHGKLEAIDIITG